MTTRVAALTAKGTRRRLQVLDAAADVLLAEGFRAVTHRRVAEAAGVPLGTTTYYFTGRSELVGAAVAHLLEAEHVRRASVRASRDSPRAIASALIRLLLPPEGERARPQGAVLRERLGEALRDEGMRTLIDNDYADLEGHVQRIVAALPQPLDPPLVLALVEGRVLRWIASDVALRSLTTQVAEDLTALAAPPGVAAHPPPATR